MEQEEDFLASGEEGLEEDELGVSGSDLDDGTGGSKDPEAELDEY